LIVDWDSLREKYPNLRCCHHWVTNESITDSLADLKFDDPSVPHSIKTHRANRIASIVAMISTGVRFKPLRVRITPLGPHLSDGHHRLRAYEYLHMSGRVPITVKGDKTFLKDFLVCH